MMNLLRDKKLVFIATICLVTFICFSYALHNQFTNWDDDFYVTNDPYIKALTPHNLKVIFTEDITKNNYHPVCMLSLAVNYLFAGLNPMTYYVTNILIHTGNVILVFILLLALCKRLKMVENAKLFIASFGALWFGIHPMHVESVCWIAERKDVLYAFFYFSALLCYIRYGDNGEKKWYWCTFLLFIASCLSKPMAVVLPMSLLCFDLLLQRDLTKKLITEKIIFFAVSLLCGAMAFYTQNKTGAISSFSTLTIGERIMYASYGFVMYIAKLFNPSYLSTFYPYPYRIYPSGNLPGIFYAAPFIAIGLPALLLYITYRINRAYFRIVAFGFGFFVANVIFVLQFISVGAAIMADRYSYVAYFGLFFMIAYFLNEATRRLPTFKTALVTLLVLISGVLAYACHERTYVWHNAETLLSDAIEKYPYQALLSYKWLGNYYLDQGMPEKALENYNVLVNLRTADAKVYSNIGRARSMMKDYKGAAEAFEQSSAMQNSSAGPQPIPPVPHNAVSANGQGPKLSNDMQRKIAQKGFEFVQSGKFDAAINQYDVLIEMNPGVPDYYFYRGVAHFSKSNLPKAIEDWTKVISFDAKEVKMSAAYDLSVVYDTLNKDSMAVYYMDMALGLGYKASPDFVARLRKKKTEQMKKR